MIRIRRERKIFVSARIRTNQKQLFFFFAQVFFVHAAGAAAPSQLTFERAKAAKLIRNLLASPLKQSENRATKLTQKKKWVMENSHRRIQAKMPAIHEKASPTPDSHAPLATTWTTRAALWNGVEVLFVVESGRYRILRCSRKTSDVAADVD